MQPVDGDILLAGALLRLDEPRGAVDADDQAARHLRVQGPGVTRLLHPQNALDPGDHLVRAGVGRLVEADEAGLQVVGDVSFERRGAVREGGIVVCSDVELVEVFKEERPLGGVQLGRGLV